MVVNRYVLDQILSGEMTEIVVENIHEYLREVGEKIRGGQMKSEDFVIFKVCIWFTDPTETCARFRLISDSFSSAWERILRIIRMERVNPTCKSH